MQLKNIILIILLTLTNNFVFSQANSTLKEKINSLVLNIFPTKTERVFKKYMKTNDVKGIENTLNSLSKEAKNKAIERNPISYNLLRAMIAEEEGDTALAFVYYSNAHKAENQGKTNKREKRKLKKIFGNDLPKWSLFKKKRFENSKNNNINLIDKKIKKWEKQIKKLENELNELEQQYDGIPPP